MGILKKESFSFLKSLSQNNNRDWFNAHKPDYLKAHENLIGFSDALLNEMNKHDHIETPTGKKALFRIYRDVRFSKNKTPYNTHWNGGYKRAGKKLRGSYYFYLSPGKSFVMSGFWGPDNEDMQRIRRNIDLNLSDWKRMLSAKPLVSAFGKLAGEQLIAAPRGYSKDHPGIELLRRKQFLLKQAFTDKEVLAPGFYKKANEAFKKMRPFLDFMTEVLTTDLNGEPL